MVIAPRFQFGGEYTARCEGVDESTHAALYQYTIKKEQRVAYKIKMCDLKTGHLQSGGSDLWLTFPKKLLFDHIDDG